MRRILGALGINVLTLSDIGLKINPKEDGLTFAENARIKAAAVSAASGMAAIADDSGLCIDALGGSPGIYSARYGGEELDDMARSMMILGLMKDVPAEKRTARFVCEICMVWPDGESVTAHGECEGVVLFQPEGDGGFGYDPIFMDKNGNKFGVVSEAIKDSVSHRHEALTALSEKLNNIPKFSERMKH